MNIERDRKIYMTKFVILLTKFLMVNEVEMKMHKDILILKSNDYIKVKILINGMGFAEFK